MIKTYVASSSIHGNGVFASETIEAGTTVWRFEPSLDLVIDQERVPQFPIAFQAFLEMYAYNSADLGGSLVLSCDHAKFLNHSDEPNTVELPFKSVARCLINAGDEITCDYGAFCTDWSADEFLTDAAGSSSQSVVPNPHTHLFTRIKPSGHGVGVFAIRQIPANTLLFADDDSSTTHVALASVAAIEDEELRRMYRDFCPVQDQAYVAPFSFNQMTMGWYLNHSSSPNVRVDHHMRFFSASDIAAGEELTADYLTYSESAANAIAEWKA